MKTKSNLLNTIHAMQQAKWIWPTLMTLALLIAVVGVIGCQPHH